MDFTILSDRIKELEKSIEQHMTSIQYLKGAIDGIKLAEDLLTKKPVEEVANADTDQQRQKSGRVQKKEG